MKRVVVRSFIVISAIALLTGCGNLKSSEPKKEEARGEVLARINGKAITMDDFKREQEKLPPYVKASLGTVEGKKQFLDNLVTRELIQAKAEKSGMDKDQAVISKLEEMKKTLMIEALLKKEIEGKATFTEKDAEAYYNAHKDEFKDEERVKVAHIMLKTEKEANEILKKLKNKESFEKLANKYSVSPSASKGGELGYLSRGAVIREFEEAAFKLKKAGELSPVVAAGSAYHIIKLLEDKKEAEVQPFEKVREKIISDQTKKKQKELFDSYVSSLKKEAKVEINDSVFKEARKKEGAAADGKKDEAPAAKDAAPSSEGKK